MIRKNEGTSEERHIEIIENDVEEKPWQIKFFEDRWLVQIFVFLQYYEFRIVQLFHLEVCHLVKFFFQVHVFQ